MIASLHNVYSCKGLLKVIAQSINVQALLLLQPLQQKTYSSALQRNNDYIPLKQHAAYSWQELFNTVGGLS